MYKKQKSNFGKWAHNNFFAGTAALMVGIAMLGGCASQQNTQSSLTEQCAADMQKISASYEKEKSGRLVSDLEEFLSRCTGTGFVEDAQWMLAQIRFEEEDWIEARGEFGSFAVNFPGSPRAEEAAFLKVLAASRMEYRDSRDAMNTETALRDLNQFQSSWPESSFMDSLQTVHFALRERQAEHEFNTGKLYMRMKEPQAAAIYLKELLSDYPESRFYAPSFIALIECYIRLEQFSQAEYYVDRGKSEFTDDEQLQTIHSLAEDLEKAQKDFQERLKDRQQELKIRKSDQG